ncbi:hypothetical protein V6N12_045358 [Hibiscus sabdariffa]|uniref:Uncharacterized protein n=1 Tax=Hibiscus sabdariffa TaxID=183260 RepID=A0ABR2G395_9ROSI
MSATPSGSRERSESRSRSKEKGKGTKMHTFDGSSRRRSTSSNPRYIDSSTSTHGFYPPGSGQSSYSQPPHGFYPFPNYGMPMPYQPQMYPPPQMYQPPPPHMYRPPPMYQPHPPHMYPPVPFNYLKIKVKMLPFFDTFLDKDLKAKDQAKILLKLKIELDIYTMKIAKHEIYVVNLHEMLSIGVYKSIEHRAIINVKKARISVAAFAYPDNELEIGPLDLMVDHSHRPPTYRKASTHDRPLSRQTSQDRSTALPRHHCPDRPLPRQSGNNDAELIPLCTLLESDKCSLFILLAYFRSGGDGVELIPLCTLLESDKQSLFILLAYSGSGDDEAALIPLCTLLESDRHSLFILLTYFGSDDDEAELIPLCTLLESGGHLLFILLAYFGSGDDEAELIPFFGSDDDGAKLILSCTLLESGDNGKYKVI